MIRSTDIEDTYKGGAFLRQWSVNDSGQCICAVDAHATADTEQDTLDAQVASNAKIRVALAEVDAVETAKRINEPEKGTPKTVSVTDMEGNTTREKHPLWKAYNDAQKVIKGASDSTNQFVLVRELGAQTETLPKTVTTTEPIIGESTTTIEPALDDKGKPILDEEGNPTTEEVVTPGVEIGTREVVTVVEGETIPNPDYAGWKTAWDAVNAELN